MTLATPSDAIAPQALPGAVWHDLMTYCERQWVSAVYL